MLRELGIPAFDAASPSGRRRPLGSLAATAAGFALLLSACGSTGPSVAHLASGTTGSQSARSAASEEPQASGPAIGGPDHSESNMAIAGASGASALKFAACMRSHGVPSFPDPTSQGTFHFQGDFRNTPNFSSAGRTCMKLLHLGGGTPSPASQAQALASLLKFSGCMRSHGVQNFPDPTTSPGGGVGLSVRSGSGLDPNSPIFQHAQQACQSLMPGPGAKP
jgi:hypothetical protein